MCASRHLLVAPVPSAVTGWTRKKASRLQTVSWYREGRPNFLVKFHDHPTKRIGPQYIRICFSTALI